MYSVKERLRTRLREIAFEALYSRFAWAYDWVSRTFFMGQWRTWQRAALRFVEGRRVLEVGMGTGDLQVDLHRAGYEAWGVDLSPQMLRQAIRKARKLGIEPFRVCRASTDALPFPGEFFDSVVSTFPSDYISRPETLRELARVLRPGGRLVIVPGGQLKPRDARGKAFEGVARVVYGYKDSMEANATRNPQHSITENTTWRRWVAQLRQRIIEAGFEVSTYLGSNERGYVLVIAARKL